VYPRAATQVSHGVLPFHRPSPGYRSVTGGSPAVDQLEQHLTVIQRGGCPRTGLPSHAGRTGEEGEVDDEGGEEVEDDEAGEADDTPPSDDEAGGEDDGTQEQTEEGTPGFGAVVAVIALLTTFVIAQLRGNKNRPTPIQFRCSIQIMTTRP
jgi:PGF-CTERM protein